MCGIAGFLDLSAKTSRQELEGYGERMMAALNHRGPDSRGCYVDENLGLVLAHTRLAVLDLSKCGDQPMVASTGEVLIYNGEIYNHALLRARLRGVGATFQGHSDTEVLLAALSHWDPLRAARECVGMFAWACWQPSRRTLWLARDRAGEKPLYYYHVERYAGFASELSALRALPGFSGEVDREALALYLGRGFVPGPHSIYTDVRKLAPGTLLSLEVQRRQAEVHSYWEPPSQLDEPGSDEEWVAHTRAALREAVGSQMLADVPVGAFLSGGIDSSLVVALMQEQSAHPVRTFTIGCSQWGFSEAAQAREVARRLGTQHSELDVTPAEVRSVVPRLSSLYSEPFADSSQVPTFLVAQMARQHVTVALTGDGADELFGGYNRYLWAGPLYRVLRRVPRGLRRLAARVLRACSPGFWDALWRHLHLCLPRLNEPGAKMHKLANLLAASSRSQVYGRLVACWPEPTALVVGAKACERPDSRLHGSFEEWMMHEDFSTYLPDDILVKVDRASMGVSLETRAPYLDLGVLELSRCLPLHLKIRDGQSKWVLRRILESSLPACLWDRPKMGFAVPLATWLRGPLRDWAESLLASDRLQREGYLHVDPIRREWRRFLQGAGDGEHRLWSVLMFQAWLGDQPL